MPDMLAVPLSVAALVVAAVAVAVAVVAMRRTGRKPASEPLPALVDADALEAHLNDQHDRIRTIDGELGALASRLEVSVETGRRAVQHVGLVRYNPFDDTGSNQSFALALLDGSMSGIVLSSLHSRQATRVYVKEIVEGRSEAALSDEESEALRKAGLTG